MVLLYTISRRISGKTSLPWKVVYLYLKSYCIKKTGACLRSHDSHFWILVGHVPSRVFSELRLLCEDECI